RVDDVPFFHQQDFGTTAADVDNQATRLRQVFVGHQEWLNAEKRDAIDLGFVDWVDLQASGNVNAVDEGEHIARFADGARGDHPNLIGAVDLVLAKDA